MGFFKNLFGKKQSPEELEKKKEYRLMHTITEELILDCDSLLGKIEDIKGVIDENIDLRINWLIEKLKDIKNHLEEAHSYLKADNLAYFENELREINKIINKHEEISIRLQFLKKIKKLNVSDLSHYKSITDNVPRLIKELNKK